jgi:hypothetical protein
MSATAALVARSGVLIPRTPGGAAGGADRAGPHSAESRRRRPGCTGVAALVANQGAGAFGPGLPRADIGGLTSAG